MAAFFVSPWISDSTRFLFRQLKIILPSYSPLFALYFRFCSSTLYFASDSFKSLQPPQYTREQTSELISWGSKPAAGHYCCVANHYLINSNPDVGTNCTRRGKRGRHTSSKTTFKVPGGLTPIFSVSVLRNPRKESWHKRSPFIRQNFLTSPLSPISTSRIYNYKWANIEICTKLPY